MTPGAAVFYADPRRPGAAGGRPRRRKPQVAGVRRRSLRRPDLAWPHLLAPTAPCSSSRPCTLAGTSGRCGGSPRNTARARGRRRRLLSLSLSQAGVQDEMAPPTRREVASADVRRMSTRSWPTRGGRRPARSRSRARSPIRNQLPGEAGDEANREAQRRVHRHVARLGIHRLAGVDGFVAEHAGFARAS